MSRYGGFRPTDEVHAARETTVDYTNVLNARIVVFQCPAFLTPTDKNIENLRRFFIRAHREAKHLLLAWKPRGPWPDLLIKTLCQELRLIHAVGPFLGRPLSSEFRYFRLHGIRGYKYAYSDADLDHLSEWCRTDSYVMFNNITMAQDALGFGSRFQ